MQKGWGYGTSGRANVWHEALSSVPNTSKNKNLNLKNFKDTLSTTKLEIRSK
jgi:hypothetical protein